MEKVILTIDEETADLRIDKLIASQTEGMSRTAIQRLIDGGFVSVAGKTVKSSYKTCEGDVIEVLFTDAEKPDIKAENIPLNIIYEDNDIIIVNKPKDMVVHPAAGHYSGTLVNALLYHCGDSLSGINGIMRPGIVHRIDKDTTGALVVCKNDIAHQCLSEQLKVHSITRMYEAIANGTFKEESGRVDAPIGRDPKDRKKMAINYRAGKEAITNYHVLENLGGKYSHIECRLETGRTHQIRVHMASLHHPLLGDEVYGPEEKRFNLRGQCLHARTIGFIHPTTHEYVEFEAPLPEYFTTLLKKLSL
ncbi:MAG: RluA family pseudouridine synthase [Lachnospiraceae bacterium]|nr:RluA family pseudouridine synthase [Lachnospiraceae bacterium]